VRAFCFRLLTLWTALLPPAAAAQWPGAVEGRALDALTREGVEAASVRIPALARHTLSDASGRFRFRALEPGAHEVTIERVGYAPSRVVVEVANGRTAALVVELVPVATSVDPIAVEVAQLPAGAVRVARSDPGTVGARTAGDLLDGLPGVSVTRRGPGAAQTASIRGSSADAVLVLVDGVPLNDPLSGEADLSLVSADAVRDVTLLPGARNARYGPRAEAGVILVRTGGAPPGPRFEGSLGSLGLTSGAASWAGRTAGASLELGVTGETLGGGFAYRQDASVGGREGTRENADLDRWGARAGLNGDLGAGRGRLHVGLERMERGLPGRSFSPSPLARQEERRLDVSGGWRGALGAVDAELDAFGSERRTEVRDPDPPSGSPYDDRARFYQLGTRGLLLLANAPAPVVDLGMGWEVSHRRTDADALSEDAPSGRTDAGVFLTTGLRLPAAGAGIGVGGTVRVDRDAIGGGLTWSHELEVSAVVGPVTTRVAHRSSFSPPTLADQFFRAGVGVAPNPDLRPERVPSEVEAGVDVSFDADPWRIDGSISGWVGDVRDMIVWSPDFRFVWSPRNVDVLRRGFSARVAATVPLGHGAAQVSGAWTLARATYDREGDRDLQLRYRPRHEGSFGLRWEDGRSAVSLEGRYLGSRLPVVSDVNRLPGFWSFGAAAATAFRAGGWRVEPHLRVDRLLDARDSMIFAFPEPGRTVSIGVAVHRFPSPPPRY
jgi:outer membrane cobalamin receptor